MLLLLFSITVWAQESAVITGVVTDENKEPLIGVNIAIQNMPGLGVITDINGRYKIKASAYDRLVFSYVGYETVVVLVKEQRTINVKMKESSSTIIDEVVITGTGAQKKIAVTGAITNVDVDALKSVPSTSVVDGLAGVVPGVMAMQTSGRPLVHPHYVSYLFHLHRSIFSFHRMQVPTDEQTELQYAGHRLQSQDP